MCGSVNFFISTQKDATEQVTKKNDPGKTNHKNAITSCQIVVQGSFIKEHSFQNSLYLYQSMNFFSKI